MQICQPKQRHFRCVLSRIFDQITVWELYEHKCMRRQRIDGDREQNGGGGHKMGKNGEKSYKTGEDIASSVKLLYLRILYRCIASKNRFLNWLCRIIARKICLYRQKCRFIAQNWQILSLHRGRKIVVWFFLSLHRWQKFWRTKLYRFIRFFSQKLCICIALNDTFLSIAAQHCSVPPFPKLKYNVTCRRTHKDS